MATAHLSAEEVGSCGWSRSVPNFPVHLSTRSFVIEDAPRCGPCGRRASVDEPRQRRGVGSVGASRRGRSDCHQRLERDRLRHDRRRRWKGQTRKRSYGSRSNRPPCTTPLSASPGSTSSTTGKLVGLVGRHRRPPPQSRRMMSCSSISRRRRAGWTPRSPNHWPRSPMGRRRGRGSTMASGPQTDSSSCARTMADLRRSPSMSRLGPASGARPRPRLRRSSIRGSPSCGRCCSIRRASSGRVPLRR